MSTLDLAIPVLPSRSIPDTVSFYKGLGFEGGPHDFNKDYAILTRQGIELHFFKHSECDPWTSAAGCYIRVSEVEPFYQSCLHLALPATGIPRLDPLENKPWGLREFSVVDLDGNLIRIGQILSDD